MSTTMTLDEAIENYHVRECGNRVRVSITRHNSTVYVSYEQLVPTGEISEGQVVSRWQHVDGTTVPGLVNPMETARRMYAAAPEKFGKDGRGRG